MTMALIIQKGFVVDGSGKPGFYGDVIVEGDKIVDIIKPQSTQSSQRNWGSAPDPKTLCDPLRSLRQKQDGKVTTIDATGCIVSPGFIDAHAHSDAYLILEPDAPSKISQGITTEINGQCGGSVAPRYGEARLSGDWATLLGSRLTWRSLAEYRAVLEAAKPAINTIQFVGHNTLRSSVVGYAGRAATSDELKEMQRLLAESLDAGGWGLTTGLIYQPGKYSTPEEVVALAKVAAERGAFYATHMRSEGDRILEAIDEVIDLVRAAKGTGTRSTQCLKKSRTRLATDFFSGATAIRSARREPISTSSFPTGRRKAPRPQRWHDLPILRRARRSSPRSTRQTATGRR